MQKNPRSTQGVGGPDSTSDGAVVSRANYKAPILTTYGSVTTLTQSGSINAAEATTTRSTKTNRLASDTALKHNLNRIGRHPLGFGLYLFDYKPAYQSVYGHGRRFGVMAQEVAAVLPAAVAVNAAGYMTVDYALLGIAPVLH